MITARIWMIDSDCTDKSVPHFNFENLSIRTGERKSFLNQPRNGAPANGALRRATENYLKHDDYVIFYIDQNSPMLSHLRRQDRNSLIRQIEDVVHDSNFNGRVFLARDFQELQTGLLTARAALEMDSATWRKKWQEITAHFHDAFANTPEEEVIRDFDEALAEVRRECPGNLNNNS